MLICPTWLDQTAKDYWRKLLPEVKDQLTKGKGEIFAVFCQTISDYRRAIAENDTRQRKICLDFILKFAVQFNLVLKGQVAQPTVIAVDRLAEFD